MYICLVSSVTYQKLDHDTLGNHGPAVWELLLSTAIVLGVASSVYHMHFRLRTLSGREHMLMLTMGHATEHVFLDIWDACGITQKKLLFVKVESWV